MSKFRQEGQEQAPESLNRLASQDQALATLEAALPELTCPVCGADSFALAELFTRGERTTLNFYQPFSSVPGAFSPTLSINCQDCGLVLSFDEDAIRRRAERLRGNLS